MKFMLFKRCLPVVFILLGALSACQQINAPERSPATRHLAAGADVEVRKSPNDSRAYRYLQLPNELRVLLVSDPDTDKSAAALSVYRGSFHEPLDRPGLAHFLEHMLFIQTEAYPEIDGFQSYVRSHGGSSNAYTSLDHTNYFFDIRPEAFGEALDRFGHFFIDPIISAEYADREKNAVHSEYQMQIRDDAWRGYMVSKTALNPAHPGSRFTIGSLETLSGDIQTDLIEFFETHYSADQMGLVVISNETLDALEARVRPLFNQIENRGIGSDYPDVPMYTDQQLPAVLKSRTIKDGATVTYNFPMPGTLPHYKAKPEQYFANLLGHEGSGSLYQLLSQNGWIESLAASVNDFDRHNSVVSVSMALTPAGEENWPRINDLLFKYIDLIKRTPPRRWLYNEQAQVTELGFRFQEKSSPMSLVYQLAPRLDEFPPEDLLVAPYLMEAFDARLIRQVMSHLNADNVLVEYASPDVKTESTEPWFQVPYALNDGPLPRTPADGSALDLPERNPFLPDNLALKRADSLPIAQALNAPGMNLWLDKDVRFGSPRANLSLEIALPGGLQSPRERAMANLYRSLVQDSLSELTYPAYLAGLSYGLSVPDAGFEIDVSGYNDKQRTLLDAVLKDFTGARLKEDRFEALKASLIKDWKNTTKERPYTQVFSALQDTLRSGRWPRHMLADALADVTLKDLNDWRDQRLTHMAVTGMLHGNVDETDVSALAALLRERLPLRPTEPLRPTVREVDSPLLLNVPVEHDDAAMVLHVQDPDESLASRAVSALAAQILQPEYFRELRTEQQLGYVVTVSSRPVARRGGLSFVVQSPVMSAAGLEVATQQFMDHFLTTWNTTGATTLAAHKAGLVNTLTESPKNLGEQSQRYWSDLMDERLTFDSREQMAMYVTDLNEQDMTDYFRRIHRDLNEARLLIYARGRFDDVPEQGFVLASPVASFGAAD